MKFLMYQAQIKDEGPKTPPSIIHELKRCQPHLYIDVFLILVLLIITILLLWLLIHNFCAKSNHGNMKTTCVWSCSLMVSHTFEILENLLTSSNHRNHRAHALLSSRDVWQPKAFPWTYIECKMSFSPIGCLWLVSLSDNRKSSAKCKTHKPQHATIPIILNNERGHVGNHERWY